MINLQYRQPCAAAPVLYSFRRCPYAMRARLALLFAQQTVQLREVVLKNKPAVMLALSPKGTVPVLQLGDGSVIEESLDIMRWALAQSDPYNLLRPEVVKQANTLIEQNDSEFKYWLDRYKYADRHPELSQHEYRLRGEEFLQQLESRLADKRFLLADELTLADIGVMPFVRQFAHVERDTFYALPYPKLQQWLRAWLEHPLFIQAMTKYSPWQPEQLPVLFPS
ncbi:glutathione S-transferase [Gilvimarinus agarilyticus]|uniref:glutathione S-transferase n=1 Tax=unclassified Gilvimarinus TaxID=2642066 RepID=UPI001C0947E3|nr:MULTISPECIES: glutathione S-transferase [unclassified Gilvimarinus]MBU2884615.1 glutathione S-transferase [Gilvimarinus agarilyticus]MDO6569724.1 glutathione S-transferase [Gilvimarinus sp. 2_MG-2023]MDO6748367.1 glutathione S-transferase [Gilvimarinus sp. 1_MG-2023]